MSDGDPGASNGNYMLFIILLVINMLLFCYESAMKNYPNPEFLEDDESKKGEQPRFTKMYAKSSKFLNTFEVVITFINMLFGGMFLNTWSRYFIQKIEVGRQQGMFLLREMELPLIEVVGITISFLLMLLLLLIFGIMIPKCIGRKFPNQFLSIFYPLIWFLMFILTPITGFVNVVSKLILRIFGIKEFEKTSGITEKGIISMVNEGQEIGVLEPSEAEMIANIFEYGDKDAHDIMINRKNIVGIDSSMKMEDVIEFVSNENYSRYPVYTDSIDNIIGILHFRDLMRFHKNRELHNKSLIEIEGLIRTVRFIPETRKIDDIFKMMQVKKDQMVIVIDEYGQTSGLVAMEDIIEEIVGEIMDEYDEEEEFVEKFSENEFVVNGQTKLEDLEEKLGILFEEEDFDTLNGYIISKLDRIPKEDEEFSFVLGQYIFNINQVKDKMIQSVLIKKIENIGVSENNYEEREGI